jgi:hypothetical protein
MKRLILALCLLTGCAHFTSSPRVTVPGEVEAAKAIWEFYGRKEPLPRIEWIAGDALGCGGDPHKFSAFTFGGNGCVAGATDAIVRVAYWGQPLSQTSLAHELWHAALGYMGVADPLHVTDGWETYSSCALEQCKSCMGKWTGIVARANVMLQARGR